jgi:uncharacterized protein YhfF
MAFKDIDGLRTMEFGTPGEFREKLTSLVIHGNKRATAGLLSEYVLENEEIEHVGEEFVLLGNNDVNLGKIKITEVSICKFKDVPDRFPIAEAEGDQNADEFRAGHKRYWESLGYKIEDETELVLLYFDLVELVINQ